MKTIAFLDVYQTFVIYVCVIYDVLCNINSVCDYLFDFAVMLYVHYGFQIVQKTAFLTRLRVARFVRFSLPVQHYFPLILPLLQITACKPVHRCTYLLTLLYSLQFTTSNCPTN